MKKILRLVTTSVLTLTLVACGGTSTSSSSSSSSSSTSSSSSITSSSSTYAAVSSITLSAASDVLTQVMGSTKKVVVTAALNANTNPNVALEWYLNGVKSASQNGRTFEFTPTEAGEFKVVAKVGSVASNEILVAVGNPSFAIEELVIVDADTLEIKAPAGASVVVDGKELADSSYYSLTAGKYVVNLKSALAQGSSTKVTLKKAGYQDAEKVVVYDTRSLTISSFSYGGATLAADAAGVYQVVRPFTGTSSKTYSFSLAQVNLHGNGVALVTETTVPEDATLVPTQNGLVDIAAGAAINSANYTVTDETIPGLYTHKVTVGGKVVEVKINVTVPQATTGVKTQLADDPSTTAVESKAYEFVYDGKGVNKDADGYYVITKPYASVVADGTSTGVENTNGKALSFKVFGQYFDTPVIGTQTSYQVTIDGPSFAVPTTTRLYSGINFGVNGAGTQAALGNAVSFTNDFGTDGSITKTQLIDRYTPAGVYTITVKSGVYGSELEKTYNIKIVEPSAKMEFVFASSATKTSGARELDVAVSEDGKTYTIEKPLGNEKFNFSYYVAVSNYQSPVATSEEIAADSQRVTASKQLFTLNSTSGTTGYAATATAQLGAGVPKANTYYKYLNYSVTATAPVYIAPQSTKVSLLYTDNDTKVVVINADGIAAATGDATRDDPAEINRLTVTGSYTYTVKLGDLTEVYTLVIKDPTQKVSVMGDVAEKDLSDESILADRDGAGTDYSSAVLTAKADGTYEVVGKNPNFSSAIKIADIPAGTYPFSIKKEYPNGRVEIVSGDIALVVASAETQLMASAACTDQTKFDNAWLINEAAASLGQYKYTFKVGSVEKVVVVNVVSFPTMKVDSVKVGTNPASYINGAWRVPAYSAATTDTVVASISQLNLPDTYYY
ncbi:MAG: hypothetical protein VB122_00795, partial [Erysipelotrichales bacterium]|nr:hypothetical protein [Erysipelotrichales bacterium]